MSEIIASAKVRAELQHAWFRMTDNSYYRDRVTTYSVRVNRTRNGQYYVDVREETAPYVFTYGYRSDPFATEQEARADANRIWSHIRDRFVMDYGATMCVYDVKTHTASAHPVLPESGTAKLPDGQASYRRQTLCPQCERFGTLASRGFPVEVTYCTTDGCSYETSYDHGD